jgi:hypothetical protein
MEKAVGPHPIGMFEVNVFSPEQFGAFVAWLVVWRGILSALVHPNTGDDVRDHGERATWWVDLFFVVRFLLMLCWLYVLRMGKPLQLDLSKLWQIETKVSKMERESE